MAIITYAEIEDAVISALLPLQETRMLREVSSYAGEFSDDSLGSMPKSYPSVFVCVSSFDADIANQRDIAEITVSAYIVSRNLRGEYSTRNGDGITAGAYEIAEAARKILHRMSLGSGLLLIRRERILHYSRAKDLCVMQCQYMLKQRA